MVPDSNTTFAVAADSSLSSAKRAIAAARRDARAFWSVFDGSPVPMVTVGNQRECLAANRAGRLLFRLSLSEMRAHRIEDFTPPHMEPLLERACVRLILERCIAGQYDISFVGGGQLRILYHALANALPGQHLIVFTPVSWPGDELGVTEDSTQASSTASLSARERQVLTLIAAGSDLEQIAAELSISLHTVRTHITNAYRKLGANNRAHAIALAIQQRLIEVPCDRSGAA